MATKKKENPARAGRKALVEGDPATFSVTIKLNLEEWDALNAEAARRKMKRSALAREVLRLNVVEKGQRRLPRRQREPLNMTPQADWTEEDWARERNERYIGDEEMRQRWADRARAGGAS